MCVYKLHGKNKNTLLRDRGGEQNKWKDTECTRRQDSEFSIEELKSYQINLEFSCKPQENPSELFQIKNAMNSFENV